MLDYKIKNHLSDLEMMNFIKSVVITLTDDNLDQPYYVVKNFVINKNIINFYTDIDNIDELEDTYDIVKNIYENGNIDKIQCLDIMNLINEGIEFELKKKTSNIFGDTIGFENPEKMVETFKNIINEINNNEKVQKVIDFDIKNKAIKEAQKQEKKTRKTKTKK